MDAWRNRSSTSVKCLSQARKCRHQPCQYDPLWLFLTLLGLGTPAVHSGSCLILEAGKLPTDRAPLHRGEASSPYALTLRLQPSASSPSSISESTETPYNFLATQVWPSARVAACAVETHLVSKGESTQSGAVETMCEFGCGPGLPSLTAASAIKRALSGSEGSRTSLKRVVATDVDPVALELVKRSAYEQGLDSILSAQPFDLMGDADATSFVPQADLYLLADVFESSHVARGAAHLTSRLLLDDRGRAPCQVWVFAQSDRAQREVYLDEMKRLLQDESLAWSPVESGPPPLVPLSDALPRQRPSSRLWLCDVDEMRVKY